MDSRLPPTSSSSYSRVSSTPLKRVDPNTTYTAPPSVLTRSMSRKSLASSTSSSSNVGLLTRSVRGVGGMDSEAGTSNRRRLIIQPKSSRIGTLSNSRNLEASGTTTSSRLPGPRRSVLSGLNELASAPSGPISAEMKRSVRSGGLAGIGQVRRGPPVVQGYNLSPPKPMSVEGARNPYSLEFRADLVVRDGGAGVKSGLKLHDGMTGGSKPNDQNVRPSSTSPAKRYDYPAVDIRHGEIGSFPKSFNFNSPPRTTAPATSTTPRYAPPSPTRPHVVYMDTQPPSDFSIHRDVPPSLLSSPAPSSMRRRKHGDSDTSEDELDFLSPKKIRLEEGVGRPSVGMLRSPMKPRQGGMGLASTRKMNISPIKITALKEGVSVPMQRATYALPPFPSTSTSASTSAFNTGGQGGLLAKFVASAQPAPPIVLAAAAPRKSGIPQRRVPIPLASVPIQPAPLRQIPPFRALHPSTSSGPFPLTVPPPSRAFAPIPLILAPTSPSVVADSSIDSVGDETTFAFSQSHSPAPFDQTFNTTLDTSLFLAPDADHSMNSTSSANIQSVMSEETAQRLNNLQAMLSKLSMPRSASTSFSSSGGRLSLPLTQEESGGGRMLPTSITGINRDRAVGKERKENLGRDRRRDEAKMSMNPSDHLVSGGGKTSSSSSSSRSSLPSSSSSRLIAPLASSSKTNGSFIPQSVSQPTSRRTSVNIPTSRSTAAISAQLDGGEISSKPKTYILRGVVAFVDVRTLEGDDAGMIFVDMLKSMGARVTQRPTLTLTHIIYKSGKPSTLNHLKNHPDPQPFCVGISWVVKCAEVGAKVEEKKYTVVIDENVFVGAQKRRRSMEPKALAALNSSLGPGGNSGSDPKLRATIAASIERARRKSLQFQPKIGSPLSKRVFMLAPDLDEDAEMV